MASEDDDVFRTYSSDGVVALQDIEESLLALENDPHDKGEINRLYRALHTLKGNSALLSLNRIETLAHAAEDMIGLVRDRGVELDHTLVELMLTIVDRLGGLVDAAGREQRDAQEQDVADLVTRARAWTSARGGVIKEAQGALRGEILVWSSLPPANEGDGVPEVIGNEVVELELLLGLARSAVLKILEGNSDDIGPQLTVACDELRNGAGHFLDGGIAELLARLRERAGLGMVRRESVQPLLSELRLKLGPIEQRYRAVAEFPQEFGIASLCARLATDIVIDDEAVIGESAPPTAASGAALSIAPLNVRIEVAQTAASAATVRKLTSESRPNPRSAEGSPDSADGKAEFLRIDARKVSLIMDLAGEIGLACGAVTHHSELEGRDLESFAAASHKLEVLIRELQNEVSAMRLVPVAGAFQRMKRVVRDTMKRTGKKVDLVLIGEDTEIDKFMVDSLHDPLIHLVRNAIDHGIESPAERVAVGKSETGRIVLEASHQGGEVSVRISDDGRGLVRQRIRARAEERGLIEKGAALDDQDILNLVFLPGFSTKDKIDELSGRGVGMDVIRTSIEGLRGRVQLSSEEGQGSTVNMTVPLTLAFLEAMVVRERERLYALPMEKVLEVFQADRSQLNRNEADGQHLLRVRGALIPVLWLHRYYGDPPGDEGLEGRVVVVVQTSRGTMALPVDSLLGNQPIMLKPLRGVLAGVRAAAGCGMLRSGDVALALDCERLHV